MVIYIEKNQNEATPRGINVTFSIAKRKKNKNLIGTSFTAKEKSCLT